MAGGFYEEEGKFRNAESEYREITGMEPDNPWGWLLLGDLYGANGYPGKADSCFERLGKLVPNHASVRKWTNNLKGCDKRGAKKRRTG
jgi:predicted Zn-dependent protease